MTELIEVKPVTKSEAVVFPKRHIGIRAFAGTFCTSLLIQACCVIQGIIIARLLGPIGRGEFAAIVLWPMMISGIGIFGSNIAIARASANIDNNGQIFRTAIVLALITSAFSSMVCFVALPWLLPKVDEKLIILAKLFIIYIPLNHIALNIIAVDQGSGNFRRFNLTRAIMNPLYVALLLCMCLLGTRDVRWFVIANLIAHLAVIIVRIYLISRTYSVFGNWYSLINLIKQSIKFGLAGFAVPLYIQADKALMLWLLGTKSLGLYVVALAASSAIGSVTDAAGIVSFTIAAKADKGDGFLQLAKAFRVSALLWLFLGIPLALIMSRILPFIYGNDFTDSVNPARLLIIGSAIAGLANMLEQAMRGQGKAFVGLEGRLAGLLIMVITAIFVATPFGLQGICLAYVAGQSVCLMIIIRRINRHYEVKSLICYAPRLSDVKVLVSPIQRVLTSINIFNSTSL